MSHFWEASIQPSLPTGPWLGWQCTTLLTEATCVVYVAAGCKWDPAQVASTGYPCNPIAAGGGAVGRMGAGANDRNIPYSALDLICASHTTDGTCSTVGATSWTDDVSASASTPQTGADADRLFPGSGTFTTETGSPTSTPGYTGAGSRWQEPWSGTEEECEESAGTCAGADPDVPGVTTKALCDAAATTAGTFTTIKEYAAPQAACEAEPNCEWETVAASSSCVHVRTGYDCRSYLHFTTTNWNTWQVMKTVGVPDAASEGETGSDLGYLITSRDWVYNSHGSRLIDERDDAFQPVVGAVAWGLQYRDETACLARTSDVVTCVWNAIIVQCKCTVKRGIFDTRKGVHIPRYPVLR